MNQKQLEKQLENSSEEIKIYEPFSDNVYSITFSPETTDIEKEQIISCFISDIQDKHRITSKCIISYGMKRSGSTLMWNILKKCLPDRIFIKTNNFLPLMTNSVVVGTYRDFRDQILSLWRVNQNLDKLKEKMKLTDFQPKLERHLDAEIRALNQFMELDNSHFIKYEVFTKNNYISAFDFIENVFGIIISLEKRKEIYGGLSKKSVEDFIEKYEEKTFEYFDKETHFHGKHISKGKPTNYKKYMEPDLIKYFNSKYGVELKKLGYKKNST